MPHGLFRRLSADRRLLSAFAATFILAVFIASLSLNVSQQRVGAIIFTAFWGTAIILGLFLYGYRRALILVNPAQQLKMVVRQTQRELRAWVRRAKRAAPLFSDGSQPPQTNSYSSQHDLARTAYFQVNRGWTAGAQQGVRYAVSFARRYAEQGDHEVSAVAMDAIRYCNLRSGNSFALVPRAPARASLPHVSVQVMRKAGAIQLLTGPGDHRSSDPSPAALRHV